ncbi:hypothetical protein HPB48_000114 [Haemaphysalis longicornis]|uniref:Hexosyltransferase n=1 Tax=Haemaphysalis longicornis TaxID=44386 RepID=A0A9J6FNC4_HAELO|nr:hypothetical protein HPB48_000114 [Haemaphysalis longicornis]
MNGVHHEISSHGDVLLAPFESRPNNSVDILLDVMHWVVQRCAKPRPLRLFVHTNDTVFVDVITLENYSLNKTDRPSFYCKPVRGVEVGRDPERANYVPRHLFRGPVFPPYCEGDAFFINGSHLASLHRASLYALHYGLVPQYVTGHMAVLADMGHVDVSRMMVDVGGVVGDRAARPNLFMSGVPVKTWTDVWLRSLYNQTRHAPLERNLTGMILAGLKAAQN